MKQKVIIIIIVCKTDKETDGEIQGIYDRREANCNNYVPMRISTFTLSLTTL